MNIEKRLDERRAVSINNDFGFGVHLFIMNNGYQSSGVPIKSVEMAEAAIEVLQEYVELCKKRGL